MTKQEWIEAEKLVTLYSALLLDCDGFRLSISETRSKNKIEVIVYVNGFLKGEWISNDCEERRRFYQKKKKQMHSQKKIKQWKRLFGKTLEQYAYYYLPFWTSFKAFKAHLINNNKEIIWLNKPEEVKQ